MEEESSLLFIWNNHKEEDPTSSAPNAPMQQKEPDFLSERATDEKML